eukprot:546864_1
MGACESRQQEIEKAFKTLNKHPKKGRRKKKNDSNPFALSPTNSSSRSSSKTSSRASSSSSGVQSDDGTHQQDEKFEILESIAESVVESVAEMDISVNDMDGIIDDSENSVHDSDNMDGIIVNDLDELTKHLQRGKKGFRYKGQELYAEINPNAQDEDIEIETDLSLTEQGIMDNTKIYFFTD